MFLSTLSTLSNLPPPIQLPSPAIDCSVDQDAKSTFQRLSRKFDALMNDVHTVWFDVTELLYESFYCHAHPNDALYEQWVDRFHLINEQLLHVERVTELLTNEVMRWKNEFASYSPMTSEYDDVLSTRIQFVALTISSSRDRIQLAWLNE